MKYTLRQLQIFLEVARQKNMSRAAESLCMSQSAVSAALLQLESQYQTKLFDRVGKSLKLSSLGLSLRPMAERLLAEAEELHQALLGKDELGNLNIGASLTIGNYLAVEYLTEYRDQYPEAEVGFNVASTPDIVSQVINFEVDIGLIEADVRHDELEVIPWRDDKMVIFCSKKHPYAAKKILSKKDLFKANWILREPGSGARQTFDKAMQAFNPELNIYLELTHNEAIKRAVETGSGIGCLSEIALEKSIKRGDLVELSYPQLEIGRKFNFVLHKKSYPRRAVLRWMEMCRGS